MNKYKLSNIFSKISLGIIITMMIMILDISLKFLPFIRISTDMYFLPIYVCPVVVLLSIISLKINKNKLAYVSLGLSLFIILLQGIFITIGLRYLMH